MIPAKINYDRLHEELEGKVPESLSKDQKIELLELSLERQKTKHKGMNIFLKCFIAYWVIGTIGSMIYFAINPEAADQIMTAFGLK